LNIICLESSAFCELIEQVADRLKVENNVAEEDWLGTEETMAFLKITSRTTLQKLRDTGEIRFSQLQLCVACNTEHCPYAFSYGLLCQ